jgi:hypothetical protein
MLKWVHDLSQELGFVAARLKIYICNSLGDICKNWGEIDNMLSNMFGELHKDFQQSIIFRDERWK